MGNTQGLHVVIGSGAIGTTTAHELAAGGATVRVVTRRGTGPDAPGIERVSADASDAARMIELARGATAIYNCANPPYDRWAESWPPIASALLAAAERSGARLVTMGNLYVYAPSDRPLSETSAPTTTLRKGQVRAEMWAAASAAYEAGRVEATEARASDFVGPRLTDQGLLGERVVPRLLRGQSVTLVAATTAPHSWTYVPDVARTLVVLGTHPLAPGKVWHVPTPPPASQREMVAAFAAAAEVEMPTVRRAPAWLIRRLGLVSSDMRELSRILYQWERPFVIDSSAAEAAFGLRPTPLGEIARATVAWWREQAQLLPEDASRRAARRLLRNARPRAASAASTSAGNASPAPSTTP